jgi:hypothetical protein
MSGWYVSVRNCRCDLVIGGQSALELALDDAGMATLGDLIQQVVEVDHESTVRKDGRYYPLSDISQQMFARLMEIATPKGQA